MECGTEGTDEHGRGEKWWGVSVCRSLWVRETGRKCLRNKKFWEELKMNTHTKRENSIQKSVRRER